MPDDMVSKARHVLNSLCMTDGHREHKNAHPWSAAVCMSMQRASSPRDGVEHIILGPFPDRLGGSVAMLEAMNSAIFKVVAPNLPESIQADTLFEWQQLAGVCLYEVPDGSSKNRTRNGAGGWGGGKPRETMSVYGLATAPNSTLRAVLDDLSDDPNSDDLTLFPFLGSERTTFRIFPLPCGREHMETVAGDNTSQCGNKRRLAHVDTFF